MAGLAIAGVALCCGLPGLLAAGSAITILGVGLGSWALVTAGVIAVTAGGIRLRGWQREEQGRRPPDDSG
jgi:hypothetical protein